VNAPVPSDQTGRSRLERPSGPGEEEPPTSQGPFVRNLPEGDPAPECDRGRGCGERASAAEPARRARADHADRAEGSAPASARVAARWLQRLLEEHPDATIEEAALAAACLVALPGAGYCEAAQTLKVISETATRRRKEQGAR